MSRENTSSIDMTNGDKIARLGKQEQAVMKARFSVKSTDVESQVVNARKLATLSATKAKTKRKAKLAKASRKKNKK